MQKHPRHTETGIMRFVRSARRENGKKKKKVLIFTLIANSHNSAFKAYNVKKMYVY